MLKNSGNILKVCLVKLLKVRQCRFENLSICLCSFKKQDPENFAFLILRILQLFARKVSKFLKK